MLKSIFFKCRNWAKKYKKEIFRTFIFFLLAVIVLLITILPITYIPKCPQDQNKYFKILEYLVGLFNVLLISYITYRVYIATKEFNELQIIPKISLSVRESKIYNKDPNPVQSWYISNASKYPATNTIVRYRMSNIGKYSTHVNCSSITNNYDLELFFIRNAFRIDISYSDVRERKFYLFSMAEGISKTEMISKQKYLKYLHDKENLTFSGMTDEVQLFYDNNVDEYFLKRLKSILFPHLSDSPFDTR